MSLSQFVFSVIYSVTFLLLGIVMGNTALAEVYSVTYPLQYIIFILASIFGTASFIRTNKEQNDDCDETGMFLGALFGLVVFVVVAIFAKDFIRFMNVDPKTYYTMTLMMIGMMYFQFVNSMSVEKFFFEDKDLFANICNVGFTILNLAAIIIPALITKNQLVVLIVDLSCLCVYTVIWFFIAIHKFKFSFNFFKNIRYESQNIVDCIFFLIIYLFGLRVAFSYGAEYVIAINFVSLVTDPQWDALNAQYTIAKIDISKGEYNYQKAIKHSVILSAFYALTSIVLFFALFKVYGVSLELGLIFLSVQVIDFVVEAFGANIRTFIQLEYSSLKSTISTIIIKSVRALISILVLNPFNTSIGQLLDSVLVMIVFYIMRFKYFKKQPDGRLNPKTMVRKDLSNKCISRRVVE